MSVKILITGGFDPLHSGHIAAFKDCAAIGDVIVGVNSDKWLIRKKKSFLLPRSQRSEIISSNKYVSEVLSNWNDDDDTANHAIYELVKRYPKEVLIFANGGDRTPTYSSLKEYFTCLNNNVFMLYNVGGSKTFSSSNFLSEYIERLNSN